MIGIVQGRVTKTGTGQYGDWFVLAETATKRDGETFDVRYMCSGKTAPAEGQRVVAQGFVRAGVREHEGKHYADVKMSGVNWLPLDSGSVEDAARALGADVSYADDDIPF